MVFEPDYSRYRLDQLLDVKKHTNPEIYPQRAQRIDEEIARRNKKTLDINNSSERNGIEKTADEGTLLMAIPLDLPLVFRGSAREYFRIWIVNLCLTILTLGIFSAWAKVRKKRYFYSHTILDGTPFQYLGQPIPILKGRVIAAIGFLLYYLSRNFFTSLMPYVLLAGLIAAPWVIVRSAAFNARYSAFRNMTFHFDGNYLDALKVIYAWGIIPALVIGMMFSRLGQKQLAFMGIAFFIFALQFPWWIRRLKKFIIEHTSYGGRKGLFFATGGQFFKIYFFSGLICYRSADTGKHSCRFIVCLSKKIDVYGLCHYYSSLHRICSGIRLCSGAQRESCLEQYTTWTASFSFYDARERFA